MVCRRGSDRRDLHLYTQLVPTLQARPSAGHCFSLLFESILHPSFKQCAPNGRLRRQGVESTRQWLQAFERVSKRQLSPEIAVTWRRRYPETERHRRHSPENGMRDRGIHATLRMSNARLVRLQQAVSESGAGTRSMMQQHVRTVPRLRECSSST